MVLAVPSSWDILVGLPVYNVGESGNVYSVLVRELLIRVLAAGVFISKLSHGFGGELPFPCNVSWGVTHWFRCSTLVFSPLLS